ncbi:protein RETICULATA-RELATED 3 [Forsythia ovata]|uniref:Protein RETICULATA-RELATED 3 n=1 Tax=Forsythia ovata TaxID=205694 RepID=A0ABD1WT12_9LAMI
MAMITQLRFNPDLVPNFYIPCAGGDGDIGFRGSGGGDSGSGGWAGGGGDSDESRLSWDGFGPIGAFLNGWRSRVAVDPQFPLKVLMEELVGVTAFVIGNMTSRPNFGLNELDFVFSTLVIGSILNSPLE